MLDAVVPNVISCYKNKNSLFLEKEYCFECKSLLHDMTEYFKSSIFHKTASPRTMPQAHGVTYVDRLCQKMPNFPQVPPKS